MEGNAVIMIVRTIASKSKQRIQKEPSKQGEKKEKELVENAAKNRRMKIKSHLKGREEERERRKRGATKAVFRFLTWRNTTGFSYSSIDANLSREIITTYF